MPKAQSINQFHMACRSVIAHCQDGYARAYAGAGLDMTDPEEIQYQCLYILNNMSSWRGPVAQPARDKLKELSKAKAWKS